MAKGTPIEGQPAGRTTVGLEISQVKYLSSEADDPQMHAILSVSVDGTGSGAGAGGPVLAEVLVIDCSSSMTWPVEKLHAARQAALAAIRKLPDGTPFAVVRGNERAAMVYPDTQRMERASADTRQQAERAVHALVAGGGTCIGAWLDLSHRLLAEQDAPVGHVLLLTDGKNQHDEQMPLAQVLETCAGKFVCDAWGIGDGWDGRELLRITKRLHGTSSSVYEEDALPAEYAKLMGRLVAKTIPELAISVTTMPGCAVRYLKQVYPTEVGLTAEEGTGRFITRAWGDERRRYQLCLSADPSNRPLDEDLQLAVVAVDVPGHGDVGLPSPQPCLVHWTDNPDLSRITDPQVDHFEQHERLAEAVVAAADAHRRGDLDLAGYQLGRAVQIAHTMGAKEHLHRLAALVRIDDAAAGRVTLRPDVKAIDFEHLIVRSTHSQYGPSSGHGSDGGLTVPGTEATMTCPFCSKNAPVGAPFCPHCGRSLKERP